nr:proteinase inhibitor B [Sagittaria sagittifolia]
DPVVDSDGDAVQLNLGGRYPLYTIESAAIGFHGGLSALHKDVCKSYVYEAPETDRGLPVSFSTQSAAMDVPGLGDFAEKVGSGEVDFGTFRGRGKFIAFEYAPTSVCISCAQYICPWLTNTSLKQDEHSMELGSRYKFSFL